MFFDRLRSGPLAAAVSQLVAAVLLGLGTPVWIGVQAALSAAYGVVVALLATLLLLARKRALELRPEWDAARQMRAAKRTVWERLALVAVLLSWGFLSRDIVPGWMVSGFVAGQALWLVALLFVPVAGKST